MRSSGEHPSADQRWLCEPGSSAGIRGARKDDLLDSFAVGGLNRPLLCFTILATPTSLSVSPNGSQAHALV